MKIAAQRGDSELATVYIGELPCGSHVEFVESVQPPFPREEKWVLIVSTLKGCPVRCPICDAGRDYSGPISFSGIMDQIDSMVTGRYPDGRVPASKFKIQFARMGDPAFNPAVIDVLDYLPEKYRTPGLMPSISTIAPAGCEDFLEELIRVKEEHYSGGMFQMQFSLHSSCEKARRDLVPCRTLSFREMAEWGRRFFSKGDRRVSLNFAAVKGYPVEPEAVLRCFPPEYFMIKLTPVNPTVSAAEKGMQSVIDPHRPETASELVEGFRNLGFQTVLSIGETRENRIGSNCGMYAGPLFRNLRGKERQKLSPLTEVPRR